MGWTWSKSVGVGPFRVNMSKSGVGFSVGGKGFRTGVNSKGRKYSTVSIPGTGIRYNSSGSGGSTKSTGSRGGAGKAKTGCASIIAIVFAMAAAVCIVIRL
jgi:hypothetical protein